MHTPHFIHELHVSNIPFSSFPPPTRQDKIIDRKKSPNIMAQGGTGTSCNSKINLQSKG